MKEANDPGRQINARAETAAAKPMFRDCFRKGRCLIPARGFYEWQKAGSGPRALPHRPGLGCPLRLRRPVAPQPPRRRRAAGHLRHPHHRRLAAPALDPPPHAGDPAPRHHALWLDPAVKAPEFVQALLTPVPDEELVAWEVGRAVNNPRNDGPQLVEPVTSRPTPQQANFW